MPACCKLDYLQPRGRDQYAAHARISPIAASLLQAWLANLAPMISRRADTPLALPPRRSHGSDHLIKASERETTTSLAAPEPAVLSRRALLNDRDALEALLGSLPASVAAYARGMTKSADETGRMRYVAPLRSAYVLSYRRLDNVFICTTFRDIQSEDQADELWGEIEKLSMPDIPIMQDLHAKVMRLWTD